MPEVRFDYAFCRRQDEDRVVPSLVMKRRQTRAVRCWVVPRKGGFLFGVVVMEITVQGTKVFGPRERGSASSLK